MSNRSNSILNFFINLPNSKQKLLINFHNPNNSYSIHDFERGHIITANISDSTITGRMKTKDGTMVELIADVPFLAAQGCSFFYNQISKIQSYCLFPHI
jgi:hypothetical protein